MLDTGAIYGALSTHKKCYFLYVSAHTTPIQ